MTDESESLSPFDHEEWAAGLHAAEGQLYAGQPYGVGHLAKVERVLLDFGFTDMKYRRAAWCHDVVEDCMKDKAPEERLAIVIERYGQDTGDLVWAVTGIGPNRKARNLDIYAKIAAYPDGAIIKMADRIINVEQTIVDAHAGNRGHIGMYLKERESFTQAVYPHAPASLKARLEEGFEALVRLSAES